MELKFGFFGRIRRIILGKGTELLIGKTNILKKFRIGSEKIIYSENTKCVINLTKMKLK